MVKTAARLYTVLSRYEWNTAASAYLYKGEGDPDAEGADALPPNFARGGKPKAATATAMTQGRLNALHAIKIKVERAHSRASVIQLEEEANRWQLCAKETFEPWVARTLKDGGWTRKNTQIPITPEEVWSGIMELVNAEGMRLRIRELEEHLSSLLPLAERARGGAASGGARMVASGSV